MQLFLIFFHIYFNLSPIHRGASGCVLTASCRELKEHLNHREHLWKRPHPTKAQLLRISHHLPHPSKEKRQLQIPPRKGCQHQQNLQPRVKCLIVTNRPVQSPLRKYHPRLREQKGRRKQSKQIKTQISKSEAHHLNGKSRGDYLALGLLKLKLQRQKSRWLGKCLVLVPPSSVQHLPW